MAWRSIKLPRNIAGSNNGETQALAFADESLWLVRLAWSEMHGAPMRRWHFDESVRQVDGMLITDSRGMFDALTSSESPQLRLRSSRTGEEACGIKEQCAVSDARTHWVNTSTDAGRQSDQNWISCSCRNGVVLGQETLEMHL